MSEHRARKRFGQNFLTDDRIIGRIVKAVALQSDDVVIEVGPGKGAITALMLDSDAQLHALEIDRDLVALLTERFADRSNFNLHEGDALQFDLGSLDAPDSGFRVVGNLPYNISTPLLFHFLEHRARIRDMYFMLQSEVVDRMEAGPGSKTYGRLSVMLQVYCDVERIIDVPPHAFSPQPKVQSAVACLRPREPQFGEFEHAALDLVVRNAFNQRRKTLRNTLKSVASVEQIEAAGVDPATRAEQVAIAEFVRIAQTIRKE
jgi:16S rRNA (adenine1518-N6/adenine1519-N6)-dimethyltransferase